PPGVCQDRLFTLGRAFSQARPQRVTKDDPSELARVRCPLKTRMSPPLRASDEHSLIVRVLRARRMVWLLPSSSSETARCASTGDSPGHPFPAGGLFQHPARSKAGLTLEFPHCYGGLMSLPN